MAETLSGMDQGDEILPASVWDREISGERLWDREISGERLAGAV
jgi:hypothetical protein